MMDMAVFVKGMKRLELFTQGNERKWGVSYKIHVNLGSPIADVKAKPPSISKKQFIEAICFLQGGGNWDFFPVSAKCTCISLDTCMYLYTCLSLIDCFSWTHRTNLNSLLYLLQTNKLNCVLSYRGDYSNYYSLQWGILSFL